MLILEVTKTIRVSVGALGIISFNPGIYVYAGSALNSLQPRITRHFKRDKTKHWHIDYLTTHPKVKVINVAAQRTQRQIECEMADAIQRDSFESINHFGSSDCHCKSHLYRFESLSSAQNAISKHHFQLLSA